MKKDNNKIVIYQAKSGALELRADIARDTIWATQMQIADIFNTERLVITKHIKNILKSEEVNEKSNVQKMHIAKSDKPVAFYSLDIILSLGYRVNSSKAIAFRQWATKTLRQYITEGYAINRNRIAENYGQFIEAVENIKKLLPAGAQIDNANVPELVSAFADTWLSLEAYDKDKLEISGVTKREIALTAEKLARVLSEFKSVLMEKREATELFGKERQYDAVAGIVGNVMQSFGGKKLYPTAEEKAAHLLYFMVKNNPLLMEIKEAERTRSFGFYAKPKFWTLPV